MKRVSTIVMLFTLSPLLFAAPNNDSALIKQAARNYNKQGDKFPESPRINIKILDIEQRVASVKLNVDDWIDYMHLVKTDEGDWKIINVLWQYHDINKHQSKGSN